MQLTLIQCPLMIKLQLSQVLAGVQLLGGMFNCKGKNNNSDEKHVGKLSLRKTFGQNLLKKPIVT